MLPLPQSWWKWSRASTSHFLPLVCAVLMVVHTLILILLASFNLCSHYLMVWDLPDYLHSEVYLIVFQDKVLGLTRCAMNRPKSMLSLHYTDNPFMWTPPRLFGNLKLRYSILVDSQSMVIVILPDCIVIIWCQLLFIYCLHFCNRTNPEGLIVPTHY